MKEQEYISLQEVTKRILENNADGVKQNLMQVGAIDASFLLTYDSFIAVIGMFQKQRNLSVSQTVDFVSNALDVPINSKGLGTHWLLVAERDNSLPINSMVRKLAEIQFNAAAQQVGTTTTTNPSVLGSQLITPQQEYHNKIIGYVIVGILVIALIGGLLAFANGASRFIKNSN